MTVAVLTSGVLVALPCVPSAAAAVVADCASSQRFQLVTLNDQVVIADNDLHLAWLVCPLTQADSTCSQARNVLYWPHQLQALSQAQDGSGWRLPTLDELSELKCASALLAKVDIPLEGLYWAAAPTEKLVGYSWYVHFPSGQVMEFGDLHFPARLRLVKSVAAGNSAQVSALQPDWAGR